MTEIDTSTFDPADARLREIALLQQRTRQLEGEIEHRKELEHALREALLERTRVEEELRASVKRERDARTQAEASDSFKETFLSVLGHELRNPLNTVLTTARLMAMRHELPCESQHRIERVVASGVRMQRMIEQLLDLTRSRLAGGIPVELDPPQDLVPLVATIVAEVRALHPGRGLALAVDGPCPVRIDPDRFRQVVVNLIGNAVAHGDPVEPIHIEVKVHEDAASLSVHGLGPPIDPASLPALFDPFHRGTRPAGGSSGLGLGLYISERIVSAHGGRIEVQSTAETGTRFEVILPIAR